MIAPDWLPTADAINALPNPLRKYIAALETACDPAGTIRQNFHLRQENDGLRRECGNLVYFVHFVNLWCNRDNVTDAERVSVIRHHPTAQDFLTK